MMEERITPANIVSSGMCIGCGSCVAQADGRAEMVMDKYGQLKPVGMKDWYHSEPRGFAQTCPFSPAATNEDQLAEKLFPEAVIHNTATGKMDSAYVGYVAADDYRVHGSSGGMVTWVATELLKRGLIDGVAHVTAVDDPQKDGKYFCFQISRTEEEIKAGAKSRYYPVNLSSVLQTIRDTPGRYAVVGIPCFIKAVQLLRQNDALYRDKIPYTLGLFCGHMKSARFVESFAWQMKVPTNEIQKVEYRYKDPSRPANWYTAMLTKQDGSVMHKDWWHLADGDWGAGFFMNSACNYCDDVMAETADISFGDAWVEPYSNDGNGNNVVIVRSATMARIVAEGIRSGTLQLTSVDAAFIANTQAAGLRQRREGLAYRLTWRKKGIQPVKRVAPDADTPTRDRKLIYRLRYYIALLSHRIFYAAKK